MSIFRALSLVSMLSVPSIGLADSFQTLFPELAADPELSQQVAMMNQLDYQTGTVTLPGGIVTLEQADAFYFLNAKDGQYVLEELWGNPPDDTVLGMVFPMGQTPLHDTWGMVLSFEEIGHVSDEDAEAYDYDALLTEMQDDTAKESAYRIKNGYESIKLIGWAEPPHYDKATRKLYWAKELAFGEGDPSNTVNYDIRALGRKGVLVMSIVGDMSMMPEIRADAPALLAMTTFTEGNRYADFDPSIDKVAAIGIGGLIAGKVLAKTGLLAFGLIFLKKFWFLALVPLMGLKRLFRKKEG